MMNPWREIAIPHDDVLNGTSLQSDFAADLNTVANGKAKPEYQDPKVFFSRTYITEGLAQLIKNVMERISGKGGEPVIQLKTSFGGGKTHSLIAVYHTATRSCSLQELSGVSTLMDQIGLSVVPQAKAAVLDGNALSPGQPWKRGKFKIQTLWGELAWQLGGEEGYKLLKESDESRTSPGKAILVDLLEQCGPAVILVDELLAFVRQLHSNTALSAGTFNANISFIQALTEAVKIVPNSVLLASLPESDAELGTDGAKETLVALEKYFGRVQAIWKPVAIEESFEIVRRRLFKDIVNEKAKMEVCRAFAKMYEEEGSKMPSVCQETGYLERMERSYPIHPQLFTCLYENWSSLEKYQKTRGTLKLLSSVIYALWKKGDKDLLIMPSSIALGDGKVMTELTAVLDGSGWEQVVQKDVDGEGAETLRIENEDTRLGSIQAARRVARTIFMQTAPLTESIAVNSKAAVAEKGVAQDVILLGCLQPGETSSTYVDATNKVADSLHYLSISGNGTTEKRYYRFSTRANLRKEMEDRKKRMTDEVRINRLIQTELQNATASKRIFDAVHIFVNHSDLPDTSELRLVFLDPSKTYSASFDTTFTAEKAVKEYVQKHGERIRLHQNALLFMVPDAGSIRQVIDYAKTILAWDSIVQDAEAMRLNTDALQLKTVKNELDTVKKTFKSYVQSCWKHLFVPIQDTPTSDVSIEKETVRMDAGTYIASIERCCTDNEFVVPNWASMHLDNAIKNIYWNAEQKPLKVLQVWNDMTCYLYFTRLQSQTVFERAFQNASGAKDFFATAKGVDANGRFLDLQIGKEQTLLDPECLIVPLDMAQKQIDADEAASKNVQPAGGEYTPAGGSNPTTATAAHDDGGKPSYDPNGGSTVVPSPVPKKTRLYLEKKTNPGMLKLKAADLYNEIIKHMEGVPDANIKVSITIEADFPSGVDANITRAINENAKSLDCDTTDWS